MSADWADGYRAGLRDEIARPALMTADWRDGYRAGQADVMARVKREEQRK